MVTLVLPKHTTRVRFPLPAPYRVSGAGDKRLAFAGAFAVCFPREKAYGSPLRQGKNKEA